MCIRDSARPAVVSDLLVRLLRYLYPKVTYVSNITDIDDKIIKASKETKKPISEITKKFERIYNEDMRDFHLDNKFDYIFIAFNSFLHILTDDDAIKVFSCVKEHLKDNGKFVLDILAPDPDFLYREEKYIELPVMDFKDSKTGELIEIFETCKYDVDTEVCDLSWDYRYKDNPSYNKVFDYQMRMYYPDTINRLLIDAGLDIEDRFGDYECSRFNESSQLQIYVCK